MKKVFITLLIVASFGIGAYTNSKLNVKQPQTTNVQSNNTNISSIQYYFTRANQHPDQQLINVINSSKSNLDIAIYSLTKKSIVDSIIQAQSRGVKTEIITDKIESKTKLEKKMLVLLEQANIPIKINSHSGLMHMKNTIADDKIVTTGSYNYTANASLRNDEELLVIKDNKVAQGFTNEFNTMWNDNIHYKNYK